MVKARRAYDAIYLLQRFARYVGGQAALALAAEVVLFKQRRLCKRVERLHGTRQKRRAEREATDRLAISIQNASRRRRARQEYQRRCERRNEVLKAMAAFLAHTKNRPACDCCPAGNVDAAAPCVAVNLERSTHRKGESTPHR